MYDLYLVYIYISKHMETSKDQKCILFQCFFNLFGNRCFTSFLPTQTTTIQQLATRICSATGGCLEDHPI